MDLGAPELIILLALVFLFFGARKLPDLARSLGMAKREFENGQAVAPPPAKIAEPAALAVPVAVPVSDTEPVA